MNMNLKYLTIFTFCVALLSSCSVKDGSVNEGNSLKKAIENKFLIGVALNVNQFTGRDTSAVKIVKQHFNSIVAENCMKSAYIQPQEGVFHFDEADKFVQFGLDHGMSIIGHCLIWHSQCPNWFFLDDEGKQVSPDQLKERMKNHIYSLVGRYKGIVKGWDVVNEAIVEDGSYRKSKFYEILGEEFIPLAFQYAYEADPEAELYYNDYNMHFKGRRETVVRLIKKLKERGIRIDAVGMQGHIGMDYPAIKDFEDSMLAFAAAGVNVAISEWDMSALPSVSHSANVSDTVSFNKLFNPYPESLPDSVSVLWNARMKQFFDLFEKHADIVSRVTVWGVSDGDSWKNNFPVRGRKDYPLLFDRNYQPKAFVREILNGE